MVRLKWRRKEGEVQSCFWGDTSFKRGVGIVTGIWRHEGLPEEIPLLYFLRAGPRQCLLLRGNVYCSSDMGSNYSDVEMSREEPETSQQIHGNWFLGRTFVNRINDAPVIALEFYSVAR